MAMTTTYNVADTGSRNPIREDLVDKIWDVSPTDTPIVSAIPKNKCTQTKHEWQTDELAAPAMNAQVEGKTATDAQAADTARLSNYTQISEKVATVSGTGNVTNNAGMSTQMAYQVARRMEELKTDIEKMVCGRTEANTHDYEAGDSTTARNAASLQAYIHTNVDGGATGTELTDPNGGGTATGANTRTAGTAQDFSSVGESLFNTVMASAYNTGNVPGMMVLSPTFKQEVTENFANNSTRYVTTDQKTLTASIDVIDSDFGTVKLVPSRILNSDDILILDPEYIALTELRKMFTQDLGIVGDKRSKQVLWEGTLEVRHGGAHAALYDLS